MVYKKEISSKNKKRLLPLILAPSISASILKNSMQFLSEDNDIKKVYLYNRNYEVRFFEYEEYFLPTIQFIRENPQIGFPIVKVDQGAVSHIINGADIFAQGITNINRDFGPNTIVMIANPKDAILALGKSLVSSKDLFRKKGKGILNIHYLGDYIWNNEI